MIEWIVNNKEWFLSGLGVFILGGLIAVFRKFSKRANNTTPQVSKKYEQSVGKNLKAKSAEFNDIDQEMNIGSKKNDN